MFTGEARGGYLDAEWIISQQTKHLYNICTMLDQRLRRWTNIVQLVYTCFVFAGMAAFNQQFADVLDAGFNIPCGAPWPTHLESQHNLHSVTRVSHDMPRSAELHTELFTWDFTVCTLLIPSNS